MKVTEQIDALETLATNPVRYLVVPRFFAMIIMLPILTLFADMIGGLGGYTIGVYKLNITHAVYMKNTWSPLKYKDVFTGLIKSFFFGMITCIIACYEGMNAEGGAEGVGRATTASVVTSFILIIASDCFFTALFYFVAK
jgi:phospholipid/cholesterol/gamma-HCH transport system permease protein